jgi:hypothetical protein
VTLIADERSLPLAKHRRGHRRDRGRLDQVARLYVTLLAMGFDHAGAIRLRGVVDP